LPDVFTPKVEAFVGATGEMGIQMLAEKRAFGFGSKTTGSEPGTDGRSKTLFLPMNNVGGQEFFSHALEKIFCRAAPELESMREAPGKVGDLDVEQGAPDFE
jgi:hypothetical protein